MSHSTCKDLYFQRAGSKARTRFRRWHCLVLLLTGLPAGCKDDDQPAAPDLQPPAPAGFRHANAQVNGINLHYVTGGQGEPVVLLHGFPQTWYAWNRIMPGLGERYTVIAPDLRGGGLSDKPVPANGYDLFMTIPFILQEAMADKMAIAQLVYRFENAFDAGDLEGHMATRAEEMRFESPFGSFQDRQTYREWVRQFMEQTRAMGGTRHLINNAEIEVDGDQATMFC